MGGFFEDLRAIRVKLVRWGSVVEKLLRRRCCNNLERLVVEICERRTLQQNKKVHKWLVCAMRSHTEETTMVDSICVGGRVEEGSLTYWRCYQNVGAKAQVGSVWGTKGLVSLRLVDFRTKTGRP